MKVFWSVFGAIAAAAMVYVLLTRQKFGNSVWRILDVILGGIFAYAGAIKALDPVQFANDVDNYKTLPWFISVRLAFYLPWLEILCGLALIFRFLYRGGLSILSALTLIFIGTTVAAKMRGLDITCGCFGHASQHWNFWQHMAVDLSILIGLVALWFSRQRQHRVSTAGAVTPAINLRHDQKS